MKDTIEHLGVVESIEGMHVKVQILQTSACSTCVAAGHCNASESKVKMIDVYTPEAACYRQGQEVRLVGSTSIGMKAVLWAFGVPFVVLVSVLATLQLCGMDEITAALGGLASLVPYYGFLYLNRSRMSREFSFRITDK